jgi:hypothetical protein
LPGLRDLIAWKKSWCVTWAKIASGKLVTGQQSHRARVRLSRLPSVSAARICGTWWAEKAGMEGTRRTLRPLRLPEELAEINRLGLLKVRTSFGIPEENG